MQLQRITFCKYNVYYVRIEPRTCYTERRHSTTETLRYVHLWGGGGGGGWMGGSRCRMSIIRNGNVALSNLRNIPVALSNLRNIPVALSNLRNIPVALSNLRNTPVAGH